MPTIPLSRGHAALVDDQDFEWLSRYRSTLTVTNNGTLCYAQSRVDGESIGMHRLIMGLKKGDPRIVHHLNGNGLDNRRENLRIVDQQTHSQHNQRQFMGKNSVNVTTVTFPFEEAEELKKAIRHFGYETMATFFRSAGRVLLEHYKRGDVIMSPLRFRANSVKDRTG